MVMKCQTRRACVKGQHTQACRSWGGLVRSCRVAPGCFDPPKLVFRAEWPITDFLGTGAGPMAFDRCREVDAPSLQSMGTGSLWLRVKRVETRRFIIPLFRAVRTKGSQPGIMGSTESTGLLG